MAHALSVRSCVFLSTALLLVAGLSPEEDRAVYIHPALQGARGEDSPRTPQENEMEGKQVGEASQGCEEGAFERDPNVLLSGDEASSSFFESMVASFLSLLCDMFPRGRGDSGLEEKMYDAAAAKEEIACERRANGLFGKAARSGLRNKSEDGNKKN
ncbi:hypothetical protein BESB_028850 [Besnoitia besnoiti]|uniref:Transmembrane protein n=1 Tax=Besnoitia besnoiti TaxID=94643 RepID=A0A2A9M7T2_BESBE|nr:uncharacterized protein BESB_028850 [Besnoitia besnoiti]PFH31450.1 hypothetical protein BESB_028850 [Besnoitia besnoiti]